MGVPSFQIVALSLAWAGAAMGSRVNASLQGAATESLRSILAITRSRAATSRSSNFATCFRSPEG
jgi:hypothetical protein